MSAESGVMAHIAAAEGHVRRARQLWNPTSVSDCAVCAEQLQRAASEIKAACQDAADGLATADARVRLDRLRGDVQVLSRLVDAALAFSRGLELRTGGEELASTNLKGIAHV